ncbi:hypothetical protein [Vibrio breoganii]|uniref:hypothetical protein n=1 Tax=Vibrio breoganii TaxID=553239 RepID=UPI00030F018E|nr:hypothetical protein [Vibrio breoganii]OEF81408.1 hypothetical protein B003_12560 [Vibrio breoganii 1C10]
MLISRSKILYFVVLAIGISFLFGPGLKIAQDELTSIVRLAYLLTIILYLVKYAKFTLLYVFIVLIVFCFTIFKFENLIYLNYIVILLLVLFFSSFNEVEVIECIFKISICLMIIHLTLYMVGFASEQIDANYIGRGRLTLGFSNPNQLAVYYFSIFSVVMLKLTNKSNLSVYYKSLLIFIAILCLYIIIVSDSRTSLIGVFIVCSAYLYNKLFGIGYKILTVSLISSIVVTLLLPMFKSTSVDVILSFRPSIFYNVIKELDFYQILFGFEYIEEVDNTYLIIFQSFGLIVGSILLFAIIKVLKLSPPYLNVIIVAVFIMSIFESFSIRPELPISMVFMLALSHHFRLKALLT